MTTIGLVTLIFLPLTTVSVSPTFAASARSSTNSDRLIGQTIFGSQFFGLSNEDSSLTVSKDFWIFWLISMPVTVVVVGAWYAMKWRRFELVTKNKQIMANSA